MSLYLVHPATRTQPAEYEIGNPIRCFACQRTWDRDNDSSEFIEASDGNAYCVGECYRSYQAATYRDFLQTAVLEPLQALMEKAHNLAEEYKQDDSQIGGMLEHACIWTQQEVYGKPCGFRDPSVLLENHEYTRAGGELNNAMWKVRVLAEHSTPVTGYIAAMGLVQMGRAMQILENAAALTDGKPAPHAYMHGGAR